MSLVRSPKVRSIKCRFLPSEMVIRRPSLLVLGCPHADTRAWLLEPQNVTSNPFGQPPGRSESFRNCRALCQRNLAPRLGCENPCPTARSAGHLEWLARSRKFFQSLVCNYGHPNSWHYKVLRADQKGLAGIRSAKIVAPFVMKAVLLWAAWSDFGRATTA